MPPPEPLTVRQHQRRGLLGTLKHTCYSLAKLVMFVDVIHNLHCLPVEQAQGRLVSIYNTVGVVAALLLAVGIDPFLNPPDCVARRGSIFQ
eukprot:gene31990-33916_t